MFESWMAEEDNKNEEWNNETLGYLIRSYDLFLKQGYCNVE